MKFHALFISVALVLAGCSGPGPTAVGENASDRRVMTLLPELGCGTVSGTGDSHPNDGKFYELTVKAEKAGTLSKGTVVLYVMNDVLFGTNPLPEPVIYEGTVTHLSVSDHRAQAKGILSNGKPFTLRIEDNITGAISEGPTYDYFWFSTEGLDVDNAYIHEGDLIVRPKNCQ